MNMDLASAKKILKKVESDYDEIAKEWDLTRSRPRPYQAKMAEDIKKGEKVLDIGCGNAVLYDVLVSKSIDYVGIDVSQKLLNLAKKRVAKTKQAGNVVHFLKGDITKIPVTKEKFDWVLALAVLHHIPSRELQEQSTKEMYRVLKPGGKIIVSVWNLYTDYARKKFKLDDFESSRPEGWDENDFLTPWKATPKKVVQRYLYRFSKKELHDLFASAGFKKIKVEYGNKNGEWTKSLRKSYNIVLTGVK